MFKRLITAVFFICLIAVFGFQSAYAGNPNWKAEQDALFTELGLKPGDIITKSKQDLEKAKTFMPAKLYQWLKDEKLMDLKINGFQFDASFDDYWIKRSRENKGKYAVDEAGGIIDVATGKCPVFIDGMPFSDSEIGVDIPRSGQKVMYNRNLVLRRTGSQSHEHVVVWVDFERGFERVVQAAWIQYYYWGRKGGPVKNPEKLEYRSLNVAYSPFDMAGTASLVLRTLGAKEDQLYVYVPAIRRVKRLSGANRSDPYMGSEATLDEAFGWDGLISSMKWTYKGRKTALLWILDWAAERSTQMVHHADGSWTESSSPIRVGYETPGSTCATWAPTNAVWVPRKFHVIEAMPKDPYYASGKAVYWVDTKTGMISYKFIYERGGDFRKGIAIFLSHVRWGDSCGVQGNCSHLFIDEKLKHATLIRGGCGKLKESVTELRNIFNSPKINPRKLSVENMKVLTK